MVIVLDFRSSFSVGLAWGGVGGVTIGAWGNRFLHPLLCSRSVVLITWWRPLIHYADGNAVVLV